MIMNIRFFRPWLLALMLGLALNAYAAPVDLLSQAYGELSSADHDYKGHRKAAMRQVADAARLLGVTLGGGGRVRERQGISDDHLRNAQGLLHQAASGLSGRPLKHVIAAERQLSVALSIR
jgi:hypothetical protein